MKKNTLLIKNVTQNPSFPSLIMLIVLVMVNAVLQPNFFSFRVFYLNSLTFTPLILVSVAQAILILVGAVDLSLGTSISLITVIMASIMKNSYLSIALTIVCGFGVALGISFFNGFFISYFNPPPLIITFATSTIWFGIALLVMPTPGGYIHNVISETYRMMLGGFLPIPVVLLLITLGIYYIVTKTQFSKHMYAVGGNLKSAWASGIHVISVKIRTFLLSGVFVAFAAICVVAQTATGDARSGTAYTMNSVAAAVIGGISFSGGKGNIKGAVMGGVILGLLINIIYFANITSFYQEFMKGVIIIVALVIGAVPRLRKSAA